jgi:hypothetical protein
MTLPYVSPQQMAQYRVQLERFAGPAAAENSLPQVQCIRSHYLPDRSGVCDLTGAKEVEELFVLSNRSARTLKVSRRALHIVANVVDIKDLDTWTEHLKELKRTERERQATEEARREQARNASKVVVIKRKPVELVEATNARSKDNK